MGGFIGGLVIRGKQLDESEFEDVTSIIGRRAAGTPFKRASIRSGPDNGMQFDTTLYLASSQEPGFDDTGAFNGELGEFKSLAMIDGYPSDRTISELRNSSANQRTVLRNPGISLLNQIIEDRGPIAFAYFDEEKSDLTIGRDLLGRKTIYYYESPGAFWFSTDLPALLAIPSIPRRPNPRAVYEYLRHGSWNTEDQTLFADIQQLPPGDVLEIDLANPNIHRVAKSRSFSIPPIVPVSLDKAVADTKEAFLNSIEKCIPQNNLPVGASLSGGTDSSSIAVSMRHVAGDEREIHTFSFVTPKYSQINEERWIDIASNAANTFSHKIEVTSEEYVRDLEKVTQEFGEPLLGASQYLQYRVGLKAKSTGIRNILDGISGDPITGGHEYQVFDRLRRSITTRDIKTSLALTRTVFSHLRHNPSRAYVVQALAQLPDPIHRLIRKAVRLQEMPAWLDGEWFSSRDVHGTLPHAAKGKNPYQQHLISTVKESKTIRVAERNAAINGIASRMPFLDADFIEHMLGLPEHFSFGNGGAHRVAFAAAMRPFVPKEILSRTNKIGFKAPDNHWLSEQRTWGNEVLRLAKDRNIPIKLEYIPENIGEQAVNRYDIIRCLSLCVWAETYDIQF